MLRFSLLISALLLAAPSYAQVVTEIRVEGLRRVEREAVVGTMSSKVGSEFSTASVADDLRALWGLDRFDDLRILRLMEDENLVLLVRVTERPSVRDIKHEGLKGVDREEIDGALEVQAGFPIDEAALRRSLVKVKKLLTDQGYYLGQVTYRIIEAPDARVDVVFVYSLGDKVLVRSIRLVGNEQVPEEEIMPRLQTKERTWMHFITDDGLFDEEKLNIDRQLVELVYRDKGYLDIKVGQPLVHMDPDLRGLRITIGIQEGPQYKLSALGFAGELIRPADTLRKYVAMKVGEPFSSGALQRSVQSLTRIYKDAGYAFVNVGTKAKQDREKRGVALDFTLQRGPRVSIERIVIRGNYKTRDKVIRRELKIHEGDLYSMSRVQGSQMRVQATGFFEQQDGVLITEEPGSAPDRIVLLVTVKERSTGSVNANFGFSSAENFLAMASVTQDNFLGHGTRMALQAQYSSLREVFSFSYNEPRLFDSRWSLATSLYDNETDYYNFVRKATGASLTGGYLFGDHLHLSLGWMAESVGISEDQLRFPLPGVIPGQRRLTSALRLRATWDSRNDRMYPSKGMYHSLGLDRADPLIGSENEFWRFDATLRGYLPLPLSSVFKTSIKVGYLGSKQSMPQENYFSGGIYSLRGYRLRSVGPSARVPYGFSPDSPMSDQVLGGNKQIVANFEFEMPIFPAARVTGVAFYDVGNVWAREEPFLYGAERGYPYGLLHSVGYGVRWQSPMGPLRLEIGYPLTPRPGDQESALEFTIGSAF
ncbi:MAG: outer membrane protein assembly factor BamA [Myxococcota bacterium]|nr:outer membrane protein assembly factor BamA [Myxococcota bacterium]